MGAREAEARERASVVMTEHDLLLAELRDEVERLAGAMTVTNETAKEAVRSLQEIVAVESRAVVEAGHRLVRLGRDLTARNEAIVKTVEEACAVLRSDLDRDVARAVQTVRATFVVATIVMAIVIGLVVWLAVPRAVGDPPSTSATGGVSAETK